MHKEWIIKDCDNNNTSLIKDFLQHGELQTKKMQKNF